MTKLQSQPKPAETWPQGPTENPGTKPNAGEPIPPHANPDAVEHALLKGAETTQEGGKEMGLVHAPVTSMHPTSQLQGEADAEVGEHRIVDNASLNLNHFIPENGHVKFKYPFEDLELKQGMFIPVEEGSTTDALMSQLYKQVDQYRKQNSEIERDENGDDVMEDVCINVKKRNEDGTVQLDGGVPRMTIKSGFRPKLVGPNFVVKAVVKGDKISDDEDEAEGDGALVIRVG